VRTRGAWWRTVLLQSVPLLELTALITLRVWP
jgi:hypothetical protein